LTVFIGKNDVGKSSILEALDIFFNEGKGVVELEKDDLNKKAEKENIQEFKIGVVFKDLPEQVVIDANYPTNLKDEYLLNKDGFLEIHKIFKKGKLIKTVIIANHPTNDEFMKNLTLKPIKDLQEYVKKNNIECSDNRVLSLLRKAIRESYGELKLQEIELPIDKEFMRDIWSKLNDYMPISGLFKADRPNTQEDSEIQDPLKVAIQEILKNEQIQNKLKEVAEEVNNSIQQIADQTIDQLKKISPGIATKLKPDIPPIEQLKWPDVFKKIGISDKEDIPLNKKGSGIRRLLLLSFFMGDVERRKSQSNKTTVIYAIEEPENSQHPHHQKLLIDNLIELSQMDNIQIFLTTHSPSLTQLLPPESIRLVVNDGEKIEVKEGNDTIYSEIVNTLGLLPTFGKVVVCVEGENDVNFIRNINNIPELKDIIDLEKQNIKIIPMIGSNLINWIERNYLENSNVYEFHIYDGDREDYKKMIEEINRNKDGRRSGVITTFKAMENYIHWSLIEEEFKFPIGEEYKNPERWKETDIPETFRKKYEKNENEGDFKKILNGSLSKKMEKEKFEELQAWEEIKGWFKKIKELQDKTIGDKP